MRSIAVTLVVASAVLLVAGAVDAVTRDAHLQTARSEVAAEAEALARSVSDVIAREASSVQTMAGFVRSQEVSGDLEAAFPVFAEAMASEGSGIRSIQLARGSVLEFVFPVVGNEAAVGLDLFEDPDRRALLEPTVTTGETTIQGPVGLVQGGVGLIARKPVYLADGEFWGFAAVVLDWPTIVDETDLERAPGVTAAVRAASTGLLLAGDDTVFDAEPVVRRFAVGGTDTVWELGVGPAGGWPAASETTPVLWAAGVLVAGLAGVSTYSAARRPLVLEAEVAAAMEELERSEAKYQATFERAGAGILVTDSGGRIESVNPEFQVLSGVGAGEVLVGRRALSFVHRSDRRAVVEQVATLHATGEALDLEVRVVGGRGVRWCRLLVSVLPRGDAGSGMVVVAHDITARKEAEERLAGLVESRERFVMSVAHELRTPLTSVVGFAHALLDDHAVFGVGEREELLEVIAAQAQEMAHVIEDFLVSGRDIADVRVHTTRCDARALLVETVRGLPDMDVRTVVPEEPMWVRADPVRARQVLRNLLTNARRYGGTDVEAAVRCADGVGVFEVSDDGKALPEEVTARLFEPFRRSDPTGGRPGSVGLGLSVSRALARLQGGDLEMARVGHRNVFRASFPLALPEPGPWGPGTVAGAPCYPSVAPFRGSSIGRASDC